MPPTDGALASSQTYKGLVACADNTADLPATGADPEMISNHFRVGTKRGRKTNDCAKEGSRSHCVVVNEPQENVNPEDMRQGRNILAAHPPTLRLVLAYAVAC